MSGENEASAVVALKPCAAGPAVERLSFVGKVPLHRDSWQPTMFGSTTSCWVFQTDDLNTAMAWRKGRHMAIEAMEFIASHNSGPGFLESVIRGMILRGETDEANSFARSAFLLTFGELAALCGPILYQFAAAVNSNNKVARRRFEAMMAAARGAVPPPRRPQRLAEVIPLPGRGS